MTTREALILSLRLSIALAIYMLAVSWIVPSIWRSTSPLETYCDRAFYLSFGIFSCKRTIAKRAAA